MTDNGYQVSVYTRPEEHGGTNADIEVNLAGEYGQSGFLEIDNPQENFEQGEYDTFFLPMKKSLGNLYRIEVRMKFHGPDPEWKPGYFDVEHRAHYDKPGLTVSVKNSWTFDCGQAYLTHENETYSFEESGGWYYNNEKEAAQYINGNSYSNGSNGGGAPPVKKLGSELLFTEAALDPSFYPEANTTFVVKLLAANIGDTKADGVTVALALLTNPAGNSPLKTWQTSITLQPGNGQWVDWEVAGGLPEGQYSVVYGIDPENKFTEPNEANNGGYLGFRVDPSFGSPPSPQPMVLPKDRQVQWAHRTTSHGPIDRIGGLHGTQLWSMSLSDATIAVADGSLSFYTSDAGRRANIHVTEDGGHLQTYGDKWVENNLGHLPSLRDFYANLATRGPLIRSAPPLQ